MQEAVKEPDSEGVNTHPEVVSQSCRRNKFIGKEPNRVISIDGSDKLSQFRFRITSAIDSN